MKLRIVLVLVAILGVSVSNGSVVSAQDREPGPRDAHRTLQLATAGSLLVTGALGTVTALNERTWFGAGRCASGSPVFGSYGCKGLSTVHGLSAILSSVLYTATITLELSAFDWPGRNRHGTGYEVLSWVHLIGMAFQPIGGLLAGVPHVIGLEPDDDFIVALRSLHIMTGYLIVGTFAVGAAIEL